MKLRYRNYCVVYNYIVMFDHLFTEHGLSLDRLRNFLMVVEAGSIAEAADREPSRQSLLSRQISELETYFGVELTRRAGKGIEITDAGLELAEVARRCFDGLQDYKLRKASQRPLLRIGAGFSSMQWLITPHLKQLRDVLDAEFELVRMRSRDAATMLRKGELDMAVVREDAIRPDDKQIQTAKLGVCGYAWFGSKERKLPIAIPSGGGQFEQAIEEAIAGANLEVVRCGSQLQMASLVVDEQACAVLPEIASSAFRRMDWITRKPFPALKHYKRKWVLAASRRQMETRGVSDQQFKQCGEILNVDEL
ncbi:LysR family transcriptional regulator [Akkermansiaceae bacterium]|nr:LysR family transcriptional regulator [Akkermansiaceae bacterium]